MVRTLILGAGLAVLTACGARGAPSPRPTPDAPIEAGAARDPLAGPWVVERAVDRIAQTVHVAAIIESRIDTNGPVFTDTLQSQLTASWTMPSTGVPRRYLGTVTDYRLSRAVGDSLTPPAELSLPFSFVATQSSLDAQPMFDTPDASACGPPQASVVHGVRDLWLSLPDTLAPEMRWRDSTSYVSCRDSIPLTMDVTRAFRVTGATWRDGAVIVTVERRTATRLAGAGRQFGDSVTFAGEGTGAAMFEVSLRSGAAVFASGESELHVTLRGTRRSQRLTQRSRISLLDR